MKKMTSIVPGCLFLLIECVSISMSIGTIAQNSQSEEMGPRSGRLVRALASNDWLLRRRAVQELRYAVPTERIAFTNLLSFLGNSSGGETYDVVECFATFVDSEPSVFDEALMRSSGRQGALLCCAIGRSHTIRTNLVILLQEKADTGKPASAYAAKIALANLNVERARNLESLRRALTEKPSQVNETLQSMLLASFGGWAAESLAPQLKSLLKEDGDSAVLVAVLSASWGESGLFAMDLLQKREVETRLDTGQVAAYVAYAFSKARLSVRETNWLTTDLVSLLGSERVGFDHTVASACLLIGTYLIRDSDVSKLGLFLKSDNREVALGAMRLCWAIGLPVRTNEKQLLQLVETSRDRRLRGAAAMTLGQVGTDLSASRLKSLLAREEDETVGDAIQAAITRIDLK